MDILPIVITAVSVSILWLAYLKFLKMMDPLKINLN